MTRNFLFRASAALVVCAVAALLITVSTSCETGAAGTFKPIDPALENTITNVLAIATHTAARSLPFPWSTLFEAAGGTALTLLAAWQAFTHRKLSAVVQQVNGGQKKGP